MKKFNKQVLLFFLKVLKTVALRFLQSKLLSLFQKGFIKLLNTDAGKHLQKESKKRFENFVAKKILDPKHDFLFGLKVFVTVLIGLAALFFTYVCWEFMISM